MEIETSFDSFSHNSHSSHSNSNLVGSNTNLSIKIVRSISAPELPTHGINSPEDATNNSFQNDSQIDSTISNKQHDNRTYHIQRYDFQHLEPLENITFEKYVGPTPESNWVIPGLLLVGAYPASRDDAETYELLGSILNQGITNFVCLQQEYQANVTEAMWRHGPALRPYFRDVMRMVASVSDDPNYINRFQFIHFPIRDCGVTHDDLVLQLAKRLVDDLSNGKVMYLHCWGGHGRTGTLVSIMLHLMYRLSADESLERCQFVHDMRQYPVEVGSPQTKSQRDQVIRIINKLISSEAERIVALESSDLAVEDMIDVSNDDMNTEQIENSLSTDANSSINEASNDHILSFKDMLLKTKHQ